MLYYRKQDANQISKMKLSGERMAIKNSIDTAYTKVHVLIQAHTSENEIV